MQALIVTISSINTEKRHPIGCLGGSERLLHKAKLDVLKQLLGYHDWQSSVGISEHNTADWWEVRVDKQRKKAGEKNQ